MTAQPPTDAWAASLDAARRAASDAADRLRIALAHADDLAARTRWASPAATVFRQSLADWCDDLRACGHELVALEDGLSSARSRLLGQGPG